MQEFCSFAILPVRSNTRLTFRFQAVTWNTRKQPLSKDLLVISLSAVRRKGMKLCMITGICLCSKKRQFFLANQRYSEQYVMQTSNSIKLSSPPPRQEDLQYGDRSSFIVEGGRGQRILVVTIKNCSRRLVPLPLPFKTMWSSQPPLPPQNPAINNGGSLMTITWEEIY